MRPAVGRRKFGLALEHRTHRTNESLLDSTNELRYRNISVQYFVGLHLVTSFEPDEHAPSCRHPIVHDARLPRIEAISFSRYHRKLLNEASSDCTKLHQC